MKWLGIISSFLLAQLVFLGILLTALGRLPGYELRLVWEAIRTGRSAADVVAQPEPEAVPVETPSFEQLLQARSLEFKEIERGRREVASLRLVAEAKRAAAETEQKKLSKLRDELEKGVESKHKDAIEKGKKKVLELLEAMQPKQAKGYLAEQSDDTIAIGIIKQLDPAVAAKVFKEFKQATELRKLNQWLSKLGQGEPEVSEVRNVQKQVRAKN